MSEYLELMRAWDKLMADIKRGLWRIQEAWPGVWIVLIGLLPRRVWSVRGPEGIGPSGETPMEAAVFIGCETLEEPGGPVDFTPEELKPLWRPGATVTKNGWNIKCMLIQRCRWGLHEWEGW